MKSLRPKDGSGNSPGPGRNGERDVHGEKRSNETHLSTTGPDARFYKTAVGQASRLCYMGHVLMENRHGLAVDATLTHATGTAKREATLAMLDRRTARHRIALGTDKAYDASPFVAELRARKVTPHIAVNATVSKPGKTRRTAIDGRTTCHKGDETSLRCRKRIEDVFGWIKAQAGYDRVKVRGKPKVTAAFTFAAYILIRLPKLLNAKPA